MAHKIFRLVNKRLFNKPHLVDLEAFNEIVNYVDERGTSELAINPKTQPNPNMEYYLEDGIAFLPVSGALTYESTGWEAMCGMTSYQRLQVMFDKALNAGAKTIVLDVNSPGGEAYGVFETAQYLRSEADKAGVKLIAYVDGLSASAGYALAASAHEIISNPQAEVGSIGVVVRLTNMNKAAKEKGVETTYVFAGDSKIPYDAEGNFAEDFLQELQSKVDVLYTEFTSFVAEMRDIDQQEVINTQAKTFMAKDALEIGLVDSLLTREEFFEKLAQEKEGGNTMPLLKRDNGEKQEMSETTPEASVDESVITPEAFAELQDQLSQMQSQLEEANTEKERLAEQAKQKQLADLQTKASAWEFAGIDSKVYAESALEGVVPVEMFDAAMEQASKELEEKVKANADLKEEFEAMGESGVDTGEPEAEQEDGVDAYLKSQGQLKN